MLLITEQCGCITTAKTLSTSKQGRTHTQPPTRLQNLSAHQSKGGHTHSHPPDCKTSQHIKAREDTHTATHPTAKPLNTSKQGRTHTQPPTRLQKLSAHQTREGTHSHCRAHTATHPAPQGVTEIREILIGH